MSVAKAAAAFLRKIGRHEKTAIIVAALRKGGVEMGSKYPESSVYTTLSRRPAFVSLKKNYWDLAERRPDMTPGRKPRPRSTGRRKARRSRAAKSADVSTRPVRIVESATAAG
jgi:hypothetical protein